MVPHQREAPGSKLDTDLVTAARLQENAHQALLPGPNHLIAQRRRAHPGALPLDHEDLVLPAVLPQQVLHAARLLLRAAMNQGKVLLFQLPLGNEGAKLCRRLLAAGKHHQPAHAHVQPVYGEEFPRQHLRQKLRHFLFRIHPHRLDADHKIRGLGDDFHR